MADFNALQLAEIARINELLDATGACFTYAELWDRQSLPNGVIKLACWVPTIRPTTADRAELVSRLKMQGLRVWTGE